MYNSSNYYPTPSNFPTHIALIPDGGRRWAKIHNCTNKYSYSLSMEKIKQLIAWVFSEGANCFSVYMSSTYNFRRSQKEISDFCEAEWDFMLHDFLPYARENNCKIRIIGNRDLVMQPFMDNIYMIEKQTECGEKTVNFCFNYNSFDEINNTFVNKTESNGFFANQLEVICPVNLLIRTGGANVLSCFLLPQIAFARLYFEKKLFNDFTIEDFKKYIDEYNNLNLKYGE